VKKGEGLIGMKQQLGKLGIREYIAIIILMIGARATEDTPTTVHRAVQSSAWMVPILSGVFFVIPLFLLLKTMSLFQGKNLFEVIQKLFGKYIGFIVCLMIFFITLFGASFDSRTYLEIIRSFYFTTTPAVTIYALLLFVCAYGAKKGIIHIGSVAYLALFYIIISLAIVFLLSQQDSNIQAIFPIWGTGKLELLKESALRLNLYTDFILAALLIPYMKSNKDFQKGTWLSFIFVLILLSISIFINLCFFDEFLDSVSYPFHELLRLISFGTYFRNTEALFLPIWLLGVFIRLAAFLYINTLMFGQIFKINNFEYLIPAMATLYLLIGMIPETALDLSLEFKSIIRYIAGPAFTTISILLWFVALLKGEFNHANKKNSL
jgi:spore germination protein KB